MDLHLSLFSLSFFSLGHLMTYFTVVNWTFIEISIVFLLMRVEVVIITEYSCELLLPVGYWDLSMQVGTLDAKEEDFFQIPSLLFLLLLC